VRGGAQPRLWAFGYADLASLFGCSEAVVRQMVVGRKKDEVVPVLDPVDLEAVCKEWRRRT